MSSKPLFTIATALCLFAASTFAQTRNLHDAPNPNPGGGNTVTHDATLTGAGTTASPLGVAAGGIGNTHLANGSVTVGKLAAGNAQTGQVLAFNGTGMEWQTPAANNAPRPLRIVDSQGNDVGSPIEVQPNTILIVRYIPANDVFVQIAVTADGVPDYGVPTLYFESTDCSGPSYISPYYTGYFFQPSFRSGSTLYYPTDTNQSRHILSIQFPQQPCQAADYTSDFATTMASVSVASIGTPPFKLAR